MKTSEYDVNEVEANWEKLAQSDPLWAILSDPGKKGGKWEAQQFFATGEAEIERLLQTFDRHEIAFSTEAVLDFGCGIGRLSQALAGHFDSVSGVDIAPTMVRLARSFNRHQDKCKYFLNTKDDLALFSDDEFSVIYSNIVLQHVPVGLSRKYISEFARVARPGGLIVFQLPARFIQVHELPASAFVATITCPAGELEFIRGETRTLTVSVTNASREIWHYNHPFTINLGNHWLHENGTILIQDDGRSPLPETVAPQATTELLLDITAPETPGRYFLELDVVQERVGWFQERGSHTLRLAAVVVRADTPKLAPAPRARDNAPVEGAAVSPVDAPAFEMNCVPRPAIIALLEDLSCRLEFIEVTGLGGKATLGYVYYVRKLPLPQ